VAKTLTLAQFTNSSADSTRPVYLVQLQHSGTIEYLSSSGEVTLDGIDYRAGIVTVTSIENNRSATVTIPATIQRTLECSSGSWRGYKLCKIYGVPAMPGDSAAYVSADAILLLDGVIDDSRLSNMTVTVRAIHKYAAAVYTPRLNCSELSPHIAPAGSLFTWEGTGYVLVSKSG
jgi:hypothetical protein